MWLFPLLRPEFKTYDCQTSRVGQLCIPANMSCNMESCHPLWDSQFGTQWCLFRASHAISAIGKIKCEIIIILAMLHNPQFCWCKTEVFMQYIWIVLWSSFMGITKCIYYWGVRFGHSVYTWMSTCLLHCPVGYMRFWNIRNTSHRWIKSSICYTNIWNQVYRLTSHHHLLHLRDRSCRAPAYGHPQANLACLSMSPKSY